MSRLASRRFKPLPHPPTPLDLHVRAVATGLGAARRAASQGSSDSERASRPVTSRPRQRDVTGPRPPRSPKDAGPSLELRLVLSRSEAGVRLPNVTLHYTRTGLGEDPTEKLVLRLIPQAENSFLRRRGPSHRPCLVPLTSEELVSRPDAETLQIFGRGTTGGASRRHGGPARRSRTTLSP